MTTNPLDVTGEWNGTFAYPGDILPATLFVARLDEADGRFSGIVIEPSIYSRSGASVEARLIGVRAGYGIDFTKTYSNPARGYEGPVDYVGQLSSDGTVISGIWSLDDMNGSFEMVRDGAVEEPIAATTSEESPVSVDQGAS